ncbi:MAG: substrate-binding domain-containing protein [Oscillospiraceae bacterium]|nr:substrate-binding domain-containing protein [Oscillospiraceae bacterium]
MKKIITATIRIIITLTAWITAVCILGKYEYLNAFFDIDNIVGMLPFAMILSAVTGTTILLWLPAVRRNKPAAAAIAVIIALSAALFPTALRGNWWINPTTSDDTQTAPDLTLYAPFTGSQTARLDENSTLKLAAELPKLDGATALYPIYSAFAEAVYHVYSLAPETVVCTNTPSAYQAIISRERDIIFVAGASETQLAAAKEAGADLVFTPIGREAFVFLAGKGNPVDNITEQQIRNIYSGKTANWSTLGWRDGGRIIAFQRPEGSGSQTGLQWVMSSKPDSPCFIDSAVSRIARVFGVAQSDTGGLPIQVPQPLPSPELIGTNSLMNQVSVEWRGVQPALGYSYRYFATVMYANPDVKLLKVDGAEPSVENIQNGSYPFVNDFYAVTNGEPQGNAKLLIDWILSPQGQRLIEETGYVPLS